MFNEETYQKVVVNKSFRPFGSLPESDEYDVVGYVDNMVDNLSGPLRIFRSAMLDLGTLTMTNPDQKKIFRDHVFNKTEEMMTLLAQWVRLYHLDDPEILKQVEAAMQREANE